MSSLFARFFRRGKWPNLTSEEIRKRARILVIDDTEFFYLQLFKKDGYTIEKWNDIQDLQKLERGYYDIILLDIQGVGKEHSQEEGLGILKHLHQASPAQIIIAYSNADFSLKYQDFFLMADSVLAKSDDYVQFKRTLDQLLSKRFSIGFYIDRIVRLANPYIADPNKIRDIATRAILNRRTDRLESYLEGSIDKKDIITMILQVAQVAIGIAAL
jgi:CheY-like chemotaxis protein